MSVRNRSCPLDLVVTWDNNAGLEETWNHTVIVTPKLASGIILARHLLVTASPLLLLKHLLLQQHSTDLSKLQLFN